MIASALGIDPIELRLRNVVRDGEVNAVGERIRESRLADALVAARRALDWERPLPSGRGRGLAAEIRHIGGGKTSLRMDLVPERGEVEVLTGMVEQGAGAHTVIRRVASAVLSIAPERISVRYADTSEAPLDPGAGGSRVTHVIGQATLDGAERLKQTLLDLAAETFGWRAGDVRIEGDRFVAGDESVPFEEVARRIGSVSVVGSYADTPHGHDEPGDFNASVYGVEVEVDRETGAVRMVEAVQVVDVGTIVSPLGHQGQLEGGFAFGLGAGLMEDLSVTDGQVLTLTLGDYKLPTAMDMPPLRTVLLETEVGPGPFGAKAVGEVTNSGVAPAIANAIAAAVGARVCELPLSAERVLAAITPR
jgi:CO/xanthine dehydrogenase Mo-binding subunit